MRIRYEVLDAEVRAIAPNVEQATLNVVDAAGNHDTIVVVGDPGERMPEPGDHVEQLLTLIVAAHNDHMQDNVAGDPLLDQGLPDDDAGEVRGVAV